MSDESPRVQSRSRKGNERMAQELEDTAGRILKKGFRRPHIVEMDENDVSVYLQRKKKKPFGPFVKQIPESKTSPPT